MRLNTLSRIVICILAVGFSVGCTPARMDNLQGILDEKPPTQMPESVDEDLQRFKLDAAVFETNTSQSDEQPTSSASPKFKLAPIDPVILTATTEAPPRQVMSQSLQPILSKSSTSKTNTTELRQNQPNQRKSPIILSAQATQLTTSPSANPEKILKPIPGQFIVPEISDPRLNDNLNSDVELPAAAVASEPELPKSNLIEASDVSRDMERQPASTTVQRGFLSPGTFGSLNPITESDPAGNSSENVANESEVVIEIPPTITDAGAQQSSPSDVDQIDDKILHDLEFSKDPQTNFQECPNCDASTGCSCQSTQSTPKRPECETSGNHSVEAAIPTPSLELPLGDGQTTQQIEVPHSGDFIPVANSTMNPGGSPDSNEFQPKWNVPDPQPPTFVEQASGLEATRESTSEAISRAIATESQVIQMEQLAEKWLSLPQNAAPLQPSETKPVSLPAKLDSVVPEARNWESHLRESIQLLEHQLDQPPTNQSARNQQVLNVRLLKLLEERMQQLGQVDSTPAMREYWSHQTEAISNMLESSLASDADPLVQHQNAITTLTSLRNAVAELEKIASLRLLRPEFCTAVSGYGQTTPVKNTQFRAAQKVLVYCEVENLISEIISTPSGNRFRTELRGSIAIYDQRGHVVQQAEFPAVEDVASNRRRDFYMYLPIAIGDLPAGDYKLHLMVEDVKGNKMASLKQPLTFSVK